MLDAARTAFRRLIEETPSGEKRELKEYVMAEAISPDTDDNDIDDLSDEFDPFDLFPEVLRTCVEDDSAGFMGPTYAIYTVLQSGASEYLVIEDQMEAARYELLSVETSLESACVVIGNCALGFFGKDSSFNVNDVKVDTEEAERAGDEFGYPCCSAMRQTSSHSSWSAHMLELLRPAMTS